MNESFIRILAADNRAYDFNPNDWVDPHYALKLCSRRGPPNHTLSKVEIIHAFDILCPHVITIPRQRSVDGVLAACRAAAWATKQAPEDQSDFFGDSSEYREWCADNCNGWWTDLIHKGPATARTPFHSGYRFQHASDAVMFKLAFS
jgi:hypothetical protein